MKKEEKKLKRYAVDFTGTFYVQAESEEDAKAKWEDEDFGAGENLDIDEIRIAE